MVERRKFEPVERLHILKPDIADTLVDTKNKMEICKKNTYRSGMSSMGCRWRWLSCKPRGKLLLI